MSEVYDTTFIFGVWNHDTGKSFSPHSTFVDVYIYICTYTYMYMYIYTFSDIDIDCRYTDYRL